MAGWRNGGALRDMGGAASGTSDQDAVAAFIGGEASAIGADTLTTGEAMLEIVDYGPVTVVWGTAAVFSAAVSPDGEEVAVYSDTYGGVAGADLVFTFSADIFGGGSDRDGTPETAASTTHLFAVDIADFGFPAGPRVLELDVNARINGFIVPTSGNRSAASARVDAEGGSTYTLALADSETTYNSSGVAVEAYGLIA